MKKSYDNILFHESGKSISLSKDEFIEYLLEHIHLLVCERDYLKKQLATIQLALNPNNKDDF